MCLLRALGGFKILKQLASARPVEGAQPLLAVTSGSRILFLQGVSSWDWGAGAWAVCPGFDLGRARHAVPVRI